VALCVPLLLASAGPGGAQPALAAATAIATPDGTTCDLAVPANPFSAAGLATPYVLSDPTGAGGCTEANEDESAFVQATILSPSGQASVYSPLVITAGTTPDAAPVVPSLVDHSVVGIWFGFQNVDLHLTGAGAADCTNGEPGSDFGQFAYCGARQFFNQANFDVLTRRLHVPALGDVTIGSDVGDRCASILSYKLVDQDPGDNVQSKYLANPTTGATAQDTAANVAAFPDDELLANGSDNLLLSDFVDPATGCVPWTVTNAADPTGAHVPSLALDQLQGVFGPTNPKAWVERSDEMTLTGGEPPNATVEDTAKVDLYRVGDDEPSVWAGRYPGRGRPRPGRWAPGATSAETPYCFGLARYGAPFIRHNQAVFAASASPVPGEDLYDFLVARFVATWNMVLPAPGVVPTCSQVTGLADPISA
jgi:hypothetical protein